MYKIEIVNKKTKELITYNNVDDKNNGEKLYYKFEIDATTLSDGEYTINVYNDDDVMVCSDTLNVGEFNTNKLQYERGNNIYISTNLDVTTEDKYVTLTSIELTVKPTDGVDAMTSVTINAKPIYDDVYDNGYENGVTDGYDEGVREQKSKLTSIDITKNGTYTNEDGYSNVNVNVQTESYSYKVNTVDEDGLRQLGWDDASINYFKDNTLHYVTENDAYVVTDENLALKNEIKTADDLQNLSDKKGLEFLPYVDTTGKRDFNDLFEGCSNLKCIPLLNYSSVLYSSDVFRGCISLETIPPIDTSSAKQTMYMFYECWSLKNIPPLITSNVTNMSYMFYNCASLKTIPLLDTKNVTSMENMFQNCTLLKTIPQFDTSKVNSFRQMFYGCSKLTHIPPIVTSEATELSYMFMDCKRLRTIPQLDTSKATRMDCLFKNCSKLESLPLLDCSNVTSISDFFGNSNIASLTDLGGFKNLKIDWNNNYGLYRLPNLTYQSVMNVINNLYDFRGNGDTSTTRTLKLNANSKALLTDDDKALATAKGWVLT